MEQRPIRAMTGDALAHCHETAMPSWLAQMVPVFLAHRDVPESESWSHALYAELERLCNAVPFRAVHEWHAAVVMPLMIEASARQGGLSEPYRALERMHLQAAAGERIAPAEWIEALRPALAEIYRLAYAYADAYATAYRSAHGYAKANGYPRAEASAFASSYAGMNTDANVASFARANAAANAAMLGAAYAAADAQAFAACHPYALVHAYAHAYANEPASPEPAGLRDEIDARRKTAYAVMASGMLDVLTKTPAA